MNYKIEELNNLLLFLNRVELKGQESYAWVGLVEKIKMHMNELSNPLKEEVEVEKVDIN